MVTMSSPSPASSPTENGLNLFPALLNNKNGLTGSGNGNGNGNGNGSAAVIAAQIFSEECSSAAISAINDEFRELMKDPEFLDEAANYLYAPLIDEAIVGVFMEIYHLYKTGNVSALDGIPEDEQDSSFRIVDMPNFDIFGISTAKKPMDCTCPNCDRPVSASRFAPHLEKCMGMGRISSRIASRRLATKEGTNANSSSTSSYLQANANTDDEDDVDWSSEKRRKKTTQSSRNGSKKNNGKSF